MSEKLFIPQGLDYEKLNYQGINLLAAVVIDFARENVLMVGYMNEEAVLRTSESGYVTFWSRTKGRLWTKGEESGNRLECIAMIPDCDNDTLLIKANPTGTGNVCHRGTRTCFEGASYEA